MGWIGQRAHGVVDGHLGALRMGDSRESSGADAAAMAALKIITLVKRILVFSL